MSKRRWLDAWSVDPNGVITGIDRYGRTRVHAQFQWQGSWKPTDQQQSIARTHIVLVTTTGQAYVLGKPGRGWVMPGDDLTPAQAEKTAE